jgi:hypothetical protein
LVAPPKIFNNFRQILIGVITLACGVMFYICYRHHSYLTTLLHLDMPRVTEYTIVPHAIWSSLPSYIHVFSFAMITAGLVRFSYITYGLVCCLWIIINILFEIGQYYKHPVMDILPLWFSTIPLLSNSYAYFVHGTYDINDMLAIVLGGCSAYYVMLATAQGGFHDHEI